MVVCPCDPQRTSSKVSQPQLHGALQSVSPHSTVHMVQDRQGRDGLLFLNSSGNSQLLLNTLDAPFVMVEQAKSQSL